MPSLEKRRNAIPEITIHERKFGKVNIVCKTRENFRLRSSLINIARRIGAGKPTARLINERITVLLTALKKRGSLNKNLQCSKPTKGLPQIPSLADHPYIGPYEKIAVTTNAGMSSICNGHSFLKRFTIIRRLPK
jgi:hypothetical protein